MIGVSKGKVAISDAHFYARMPGGWSLQLSLRQADTECSPLLIQPKTCVLPVVSRWLLSMLFTKAAISEIQAATICPGFLPWLIS